MEKKDKKILQDPLTLYYTGKFRTQWQKAPGIQSKMDPRPDCGEETYTGNGRLEGRKALITGGDSGIGRAVAIAFAREGADVALNYLPEEESDAREVAILIEQAGRKAVLIPGDITNEDFCKEMVQRAYRELDGLDILVPVAGKQVALAHLEDLTTEQLRKTFETNVFALFWTVKAALPLLPPGSAIITTSSIEAFRPAKYLLDYAATKSAIAAFTRGLAKQVASKGIRVNSVAPGPIWTPLQISGGQLEENLKDFGHDTPLKRAGEPAELAAAYVLLASPESSYTTAEVYGVTGGRHTS